MKKISLFLLFVLLFTALTPAAYAVRVKDICSVEGVRENQLLGYGLVVGLNNSGDDKSPGFTVESLTAFMRKNGINLEPSAISVKNVAAVMVTAKLPPFARQGTEIDVVVSALGNSSNLQGGVLIATPLRPSWSSTNDPESIYAVAQGNISTGGYAVAGQGGSSSASQVKNHPTTAMIPSGAIVEKEVKTAFATKPEIQLLLRNPDFTTALRVAQMVNSSFGHDTAQARDATSVAVKMPSTGNVEERVAYLSKIEGLEVSPDAPARVVYNERTGTIVMGSNVRISTTIITHGNLILEKKGSKSSTMTQTPPSALIPGQNMKSENEDYGVKATEEKGEFRTLEEGVTIGEVARGLNALGVSSRDIISILQALKRCGALQAELVAM